MEKVEIRVVRNHEVQVAVSIIIYKSTTATPGLSIACHASVFPNFFKFAFNIVVKPVLPVIGDVKIFPAVVVVVSDTYSLAPACCRETRTCRHVSKGSIVIVMI